MTALMDTAPGALSVVGFEGTAPGADLERWIRRYRPAGFILFERNIGQRAEDVAALTGWLRQLVWELDALPPLLAIDHEGGAVHRLKGHATRFPPWRETVETQPGEVARIARQQGKELRQLGFNWLLGPVADLSPERTLDGRPTVLGKRCMGADPGRAVPLLRDFLRGCSQAGILTCAKHFPGYGSVTLDPHDDLPRTAIPPEEWRENDLAAFAGLLPEPPDAIMLAHLRSRLFRSELPASLDPAAINFLRRDLGYQGIILPDDLAMGAILKAVGWLEAGRLAVVAGLDLLLLCHPNEPENGAIGAMLDDLARHQTRGGAWADSLERVSALRRKVETLKDSDDGSPD